MLLDLKLFGIPGIFPITPTGAPAVAAPDTDPAIGNNTAFEVLTKPTPVLLPAANTPPLPLLPIPPPVGVLGEEDDGDVDCDDVAADWQQLLLWYDESKGDKFLPIVVPTAEGVVGELMPAAI